jgi:AP-4 complex subunit beta-1
MSRLPNILEYLREPLQAGLGDRSPYVRKTCVMGIVKLFHVAPEFVEGMCTYMYVLDLLYY